MAVKTLEQFYKEYRSGFNLITGEPNLFKDLTDEHVWNAAIKSVEENGSSYNSDYATALYKWRDEHIDTLSIKAWSAFNSIVERLNASTHIA